MLNGLSRRRFLVGGLSIIAAPALVRAESMDAILRGEIMDPKVLVFSTGSSTGISCVNGYSRAAATLASLFSEVNSVNNCRYKLVRMSETNEMVKSHSSPEMITSINGIDLKTGVSLW